MANAPKPAPKSKGPMPKPMPAPKGSSAESGMGKKVAKGANALTRKMMTPKRGK